MKVLVGKSPATDFKTLSQECGLQCETNGSYNKYKHWKHDTEASLKPPSRFRVAAVQNWFTQKYITYRRLDSESPGPGRTTYPDRFSSSKICVNQIKAKVLFRFKTPNESIKATRKSSLNDGIKEVAEIKETMKSAREGVKSSLRQETRAARLLFGTSSN